MPKKVKKKVKKPKKKAKKSKKKKDDPIEEAAEKAVKVVKKRRVPLTVIVILVILLLIAVSFLGLTINFKIKSELDILMTPSEVHLEVTENKPVHLAFNIQNNNFKVCKSNCSYRLRDLSSDTIIKTENKILSSKESFDINYVVTVDEKDEGQKLYLFETECNNIKGPICRSSEKRKMQSSLVTIDYKLSEEGKKIKFEAGNELNRTIVDVAEAKSLIISNRKFLNSAGFVDLAQTNDALTVPDVDELVELWEQKEFVSLGAALDIFDNQVLEQARNLKNTGVERAKEHNLLVNLVNKTISSNLEEMIGFYSVYNLDIAENLTELSWTANTIMRDIIGNNFDYTYSNSRLASINADIEQFGVQYAKDYAALRTEHENSIATAAKALGILGVPIANSTQCEQESEIMNKSAAWNNAATIKRASYTNQSSNFWDRVALHKQNLLLEADGKEKIPLPIIANSSNSTSGSVDYDELIILNFTFNNYCHAHSAAMGSGGLLIAPNISHVSETYVQEITTPELLEMIKPECCIFGECSACCPECTTPYPVLFIHGHAVNEKDSPEASLASFAKIQAQMLEDGYINAGQIGLDSEDIPWGDATAPFSVRATYYYISYYDLGDYQLTTLKTEGIENYAIRLKELIDLVLEKSGKDKLVIVAHSMGGLVAREYLTLFGEDDISKLIMVGTPNHGVKGSVKEYCGLIGSDKECRDMAEDSIFLKRLNEAKNTPSIPVYTIRAEGCDMKGIIGDGVVTGDSVQLDFAKNFLIEGECTDFLGTSLHSDMLDPDLYPETYGLILGILTT